MIHGKGRLLIVDTCGEEETDTKKCFKAKSTDVGKKEGEEN